MAKPTKKINLLRMALDLELNQPSDRVIQIGCVVGNIRTGEIVARFSQLVVCGEPLCTVDDRTGKLCDIPRLTGITEERLAKDGVALDEAYRRLVAFAQESGLAFDKKSVTLEDEIWTWGGGDQEQLVKQLVGDYPGIFATTPCVFRHRFRDLKTVFVHFSDSPGCTFSPRGGLSKALKKLTNRDFQGRAHDACDDALNTFAVGFDLLTKFKSDGGVK